MSNILRGLGNCIEDVETLQREYLFVRAVGTGESAGSIAQPNPPVGLPHLLVSAYFKFINYFVTMFKVLKKLTNALNRYPYTVDYT